MRRFIRPARNVVAVLAIPLAVGLAFFVFKSVALTLILATVAALVSVVCVTSAKARNVFLGLFTVILCIGISEAVLRFTSLAEDPAVTWNRGRQQHYSAQVFQQDWDLGYTVLPNSSANVWCKRDGQPVYDVTYRFDAAGGRMSSWAPTKDHTIVVAGDSFNFGEGLNDDQTLSSLLQARVGNRLSVPNLALPGYGVHQVLRQLELDVPARHGAKTFDWLVVSIVDNHIERANGRYSWSAGGPKYAIGTDGVLRVVGRFEADSTPEWRKRLLAGSRFYATLAAVFGRLGTSQDERVFTQIMRAMKETAERKYKARLLVLYHSGAAFLGDYTGRRVLMNRLLRDAGVAYIDVNATIPNIDASYFIPGDGHPSAKLNAALADLVLKAAVQ